MGRGFGAQSVCTTSRSLVGLGCYAFQMELWELEARDAARDLIARYNANGDSGRYDQVVELFAPDAVMQIGDGKEYVGLAEIRTIFTSTGSSIAFGSHPIYLRHMTATHQIDVIDENLAKGRCYYLVLTAIGLDHWGRYVDEYRPVEGVWKFSRRTVTIDGRSEASLFGNVAPGLK
jgi:hypothetical protein